MSSKPKGYYVYQLRLDGAESPFYIGKGHGSRAWHHFRPSNLILNSGANDGKITKILDAQACGIQVLVEVLVDGLTEVESIELEESMILKYGRLDIGTGYLTNLNSGGAFVLTPESLAIKAKNYSDTWKATSQEQKDIRSVKQSESKKVLFADPVRGPKAREAYSSWQSGVKKSQSSIEKMKATKAAQFSDPEYAARIREAKRESIKKWYENGGVNPFKGKSTSQESIEKMRATKAAKFADPIQGPILRAKMSEGKRKASEARKAKKLEMEASQQVSVKE